MSPGVRKKTKKNVMAWMEPEEIALLRKSADALAVNKTRFLKMAIKLANAHLEEMEQIKKEEDETKH